MCGPFELSVRPRHVVMHLSGEFDGSSKLVLDSAMLWALQWCSPVCPRVVVDLSDVTSFDTSNVEVLWQTATRLSARDGCLVVAGPCRMVAQALDATGYARAWPVTEEVEDAVAELHGRPRPSSAVPGPTGPPNLTGPLRRLRASLAHLLSHDE